MCSAYTRNTASVPSARRTYTRSPGRSRRSRKKTPGPRVESMCPAMIDEPISPGRGLPVYQPASVVLAGTWRVPCGVRPSLSSGVRTPMAGMVSATGRATRLLECGRGGAAKIPRGTGEDLASGRATSPGCPVSRDSPAAPPATASSPASATAAATGRRTSLAREPRCPPSGPAWLPSLAEPSFAQMSHGCGARPAGGSPGAGNPPVTEPAEGPVTESAEGPVTGPAGGSARVTGDTPRPVHPVGARGGDQPPGRDQADPQHRGRRRGRCRAAQAGGRAALRHDRAARGVLEVG